MTGKLANKVALVTGGRWDWSRLTGSIASIKGFPSFSVYNASKAAVRSFARSWIADLKGARNPHQCAEARPCRDAGPVRPDVRESRKRRPWLWSHWANRDARRSGQSRGVPRFRRERLRHRHRTLRRWRCGADLRNAVSVALAAVTVSRERQRDEQPKNPLWPLV